MTKNGTVVRPGDIIEQSIREIDWQKEAQKLATRNMELEQEMERQRYLAAEHLVRVQHYTSPDEPRENLVTLSAQEKAKVFQNMVLAVNRVGRTVGEEVKHDLLTYHDRDFKAAERFFQANPQWCVADLARILDCCVETKLYFGTTGYTDNFPVQRGHVLGYFFPHLEEILNKLECWGSVPGLHALSKNELYPAKRKHGAAK